MKKVSVKDDMLCGLYAERKNLKEIIVINSWKDHKQPSQRKLLERRTTSKFSQQSFPKHQWCVCGLQSGSTCSRVAQPARFFIHFHWTKKGKNTGEAKGSKFLFFPSLNWTRRLIRCEKRRLFGISWLKYADLNNQVRWGPVWVDDSLWRPPKTNKGVATRKIKEDVAL